MNAQVKDTWLAECRKFSIDPEEIDIVAGRYDAYRKYTLAAKAEVLSVKLWFHWYHMERKSENQNLGAAPDACSVDNRSQGNSLIQKPDVFLKLLRTRITHS